MIQRIAKLSIALAVAFMVAACGGNILKHSGTFILDGKKIGLGAEFQPTTGGFGINAGLKAATFIHVPNSLAPAGEAGTQGLLSGEGNDGRLDSRAVMVFSGGEAAAKGNGGAVAFTEGKLIGWPAVYLAMGMACNDGANPEWCEPPD